jgi:hypothetical protein
MGQQAEEAHAIELPFRMVDVTVSLPFGVKRSLRTVIETRQEGEEWKCFSAPAERHSMVVASCYPDIVGRGTTESSGVADWTRQGIDAELRAAGHPGELGLRYLNEILEGRWGEQCPDEAAIIRRALRESVLSEPEGETVMEERAQYVTGATVSALPGPGVSIVGFIVMLLKGAPRVGAMTLYHEPDTNARVPADGILMYGNQAALFESREICEQAIARTIEYRKKRFQEQYTCEDFIVQPVCALAKTRS